MSLVIRYKLNQNYFYLSFITLGFPTGLWRGSLHAKRYDNESDAHNDIERLKANGYDTPDLEIVNTQQIEEVK
jgi:hypothetical protein